jgi:4-amino-4-deoxy-L-arabinose transferase-like glycosyltransferase
MLSRPGIAVYVTLTLLILGACLLSASTWRVYSHTWDEPEHLAAGIELLDRGRYEYDTEHPPIGRAMIALGPYLAGAHSFGTPPPDGVQEGIDILYTGGHYQLFLMLARLGTLPFLAILLFATWLWARKLTQSTREALLAVALLAAVPPILGHAALATLDVACAATTVLALYTLQRWISNAGWRDAALFGVTAGIAVGTKFSAIPFIGLGLIVLTLAKLWATSPVPSEQVATGQASSAQWIPKAVLATRFAGLALVILCVAIPLGIAYGIRSPHAVILFRFHRAVSYLFHEHGLSHEAGALLGQLWLPRSVMGLIEGIVSLKAHNDTGHMSFLLGQTRSGGWWYFYLVALAVKTPIPLLIAAPLGFAMQLREGWKQRNTWLLAPVILFLTTLVFASLVSRINIGIRHVLLLYPFMALGAAHALAQLWRYSQRARTRWVAVGGSVLAAALAIWQLSTLWTAHPDYLPYFNETVGHPEQVLVDSDLDWGQDLRRLEWRLAELKVHEVNLAWIGTADLHREPLPSFTLLPPGKPTTGWVAISALAWEHQMKGYLWLHQFKPVERIGKTIDLYYVPLYYVP